MLQPGATVDRYEILDVLGEGGMAVVYRARHIGLGTLHAVKHLRAWRSSERDRLVQEAQIQARLRHPNVVPVTDLVSAGEDVFVVMELVDGPNLDRWALGHRSRTERLAVFRGVAAGVAAAHAIGVIHRDLKPGNVLMHGEVPRVADFGLARPSTDAVETKSRVALGTPAYMAPEQWSDAATVDERADVWALGCILFEMITGHRAFPQEDLPGIAMAVTTGRPATLPEDLDAPTRAAIEGCLQVDRRARIPSVRALLEVLDGGGGPPTEEPRPSETMAPASWAGPAPSIAPSETMPPGSWEEPAPRVPASNTPPPEARVARVPVLLADPITGQAAVATLVVHARPGRGEVRAVGNFAADALQAVEIAVRAALGPRGSAWDLWWLLDGVTVPVEGPSLGLGAAVAALATVRGAHVPADVAFTGRVALDGSITTVGYLPAKQRAARAAGLARVWTGAGGSGEDLVVVETVAVVQARLIPAPWRGRAIAAAALVAGPVVALVGIGAALDLAADELILRIVNGPLPADHTVVVAVPMPPDHDLAAVRPAYGELVTRLGAAGVAVVAFDVAMTEARATDDDLAAAFSAAAIPIVLGARQSATGPVLPKSAALAAAGRPGLAAVEPEWPAIVLGRIPAASRWPGSTVYALSVEAVQALTPRARGPEVTPDTLVAGGREIPLDGGRFLLHPADPAPVIGLRADDPTHPWSAVDLHGRIALVGVVDAVDVIHTATGAVAGVQVHAAAIETLLAGHPPRTAGLLVNLGAAALAAAGTFGLARVRPILGAVGAVVVVGAVLLAAKAAVLLASVSLVIAVAGGVVAARALSR